MADDNELFQTQYGREAVSRDTSGTEAAAREAAARDAASGYSGPQTSGQSLGAMREAIGFSNPAVQAAVQTAMNVATPGLGAAYGAARTGLGALAAAAEAIEEGAIGDIAGTRERETEMDAVEAAGFGYGGGTRGSSLTSSGGSIGLSRTDRASRALGLDDSAFGLSAAFGSTSLGMLAAAASSAFGGGGSALGGYSSSGGVDPLGRDVGLSNIGTPGYDFGLDVSSNLGSFGSIGSVGQSKLGNLAASLDSRDSEGSGGNGPGEGGGLGGGIGGGLGGTSDAGGTGASGWA